jgi:phosphatidylserine/phosphatidylglycerophosphate/cardiolipin synthase-like enzyme
MIREDPMLSDIVRLTDQELDQLLDALSQGTIAAGANRQQIRKAGLDSRAEQIHEWLPEAVGLFGSIAGVTAAVRLLRDERRRVAKTDPHPELVITGPDLGGVGSRDTRVAVREMFESARRSVLIVGHAFYGSDWIFKPLADRMVSKSGLTVRIVVNVHPERGLSAERNVRKFGEDFLRTSWPFEPAPEIYYSPGSLEDQGSGLASVHAKLIVVDLKSVYLGSANFTTAAFERNVEAGIRLRSPEMGRRLTEYFDQMIGSGYLRALNAAQR